MVERISKIRQARRGLTILLFLSSLLILFNIHPVSGQALQVDVWTNKGGQGVSNLNGGTYYLGEVVTIYCSVSSAVDRLVVTIYKPDGSVLTLYDGAWPGGIFQDSGTAGYPLGKRRVICQAWKGNLSISDEVDYNVIGCPAHTFYLGVEIKVLNDEDLELMGWFRPEDASWDDFVNLCWNGYPGKDYYINNYLKLGLLYPMFGIRKAAIKGSGLDNSRQRVWLKLKVKFKDLSRSDYELKILRFRDPIKSAGTGFVDEIHLTSFKDIWKANPSPTHRTDKSIDWINTNMASAPLDYEVYLYAIASLRIRVEGIPPDMQVSVSIDGRDVGSIKPGEAIEEELLGEEHMIEVKPELIQYSNDTRYRCEENLIHISGSGEVIFKYRAEYRVILSSSKAGLTIDGIHYDPSGLPFEDWWEEGSIHEVVADEVEIEQVSDVKRTVFQFSKWSDGYSSRTREIQVSGPIRLTAIYHSVTQYYVSVESKYGRTVGSGWYNEGEEACIGLRGVESENGVIFVPITKVERVVFQGWTGDLVTSASKKCIKVDSPKSIVATWRKQYFLTITTEHGIAYGSGWYYDGEQAKVSIRPTTIYTADKRTRYIFDGWTGDYSSAEREFMTVVNRPMTIRAKWFAEHLVELQVMPEEIAERVISSSEKWIKSGEKFVMDVGDEIPISNDTKYVFVDWSVDGKTSKSKTIEVVVTRPLKMTISYEPWYYVLVRSPYGEVTGSGWYRSGSDALISIKPTKIGFLIMHVFDGWMLDGEFIGQDPAHLIRVNRPVVLTARWRTDYTQLLILAVILGLIGGFMGFIGLKKIPLHRLIHYRVLKERPKKHEAEEITDIREKLAKLEEAYRKGEISEEVYKRLKQELEERLHER